MANSIKGQPVDTQKGFFEVSIGLVQALGAELTRQAEHQGLPAVSTIREPAVITLRLGQVLPETKNGFLNRIVNGLRNLTLPMGIGSPSIGYYRKTQALPISPNPPKDGV